MLNIITNHKRKSNIFDLNHFFSDIIPDSLLHNSNKMMRLNIKEADTFYEFEVEMPGVRKEDINVSISDDILTISVNKTEEINEETTRFIRKERKYGTYSRSFSIPNVNSELISANYDNGVLRLVLPKTDEQETTTKMINIE